MAEQKKEVGHVVTKPNKTTPPDTLTLVKFNLNEDKYLKSVVNFFDGDKNAGMRFMTGFVDTIRRNPKLLECTPISLINSAMMFASFRFMPSTVAGEAYMIQYKNKGVPEAQFQMGYQGYVVLFYRAGVRAIQAEIVRDADEFTLENGIPVHKIDPRKSKESRGKAIGVYVRVVLPSGEPVYKYMNGEDIISFAKRFSKSYFKYDYNARKLTDEVDANTPWNEVNDPELHMWKKTALLQMKSMLPKNSELVRAMEEDFKDSTVYKAEVLDPVGPATAKVSHDPMKLLDGEPEVQVGAMDDAAFNKVNEDLKRRQEEAARLNGDGINVQVGDVLTPEEIAVFEDAERKNPE